MNQPFPRYLGSLPDYLGDLRGWVFRKQVQAADHFQVSHTTISRYENGKLTPPLNYVIQLIKLVVERFQRVSSLSSADYQAILDDVNVIIQTVYPDHRFINNLTELWSDDHPGLMETRTAHLARIHWSGTPTSDRFYGRQTELDNLHQWIEQDRSRIVALLGIGGIGKTSLAVHYCLFAQTVFDDILWISLRNAPLLSDVLTECIRFYTHQQQDGRSTDREEQIRTLLSIFRQKRCLLVIDNFESVLLEGELAGTYQSSFLDYGLLLQQIGSNTHQSCVLLTSREKPIEILALETEYGTAHSLVLGGLSKHDARQVLLDHGKNLDERIEEIDRLIDQVVGSPLALQWLPALIDFYSGDITQLLADGAVITGDIFPLLQQQFQRLSPLEVDILFWLAIEREAVSLKLFQEVLLPAVNRADLVNGLLSLQRRSLIENSRKGFLLQNLVMEYVTYLFVNRVCEEIITGNLQYFQSHALYRVQTKEFITQAQRRLIVQPVAEQLKKRIWKPAALQQIFSQILDRIRQDNGMMAGYAPGNILRLAGSLKMDLAGLDFSYLPVWDVDLRHTLLHNVNFSASDLNRTVFTEVFGRVLCLAFSPTGKLLAAGTTEGEILIIGVDDFSIRHAVQGHTDWIRSLDFDSSGEMLLSAGDDGKIKLWDSQTGQCLKIMTGHTGRVMTAVFHPKQPMLASGGEDGTIRLWNLRTGACERMSAAHTQWVYALRFTSDGRRLVSGSSDMTLKVWDLDQPDDCLATLTAHTGPVWTLAISPNQTLLASSGEDQTVKIWQLDSGELLQTLPAHPSGIRSVAFSPDGSTLAVPSGDTVYIYSVDTGARLARLTGHTSYIWAVHFSPDGSFLASAGLDKTLRVWSTQDYQCLFTLSGYQNAVPAVAFDPAHPSRLIGGSQDGKIRLWDTATGQCLQTIERHKDRIKRVCFSEAGRLFATAGDDALACLWDANQGSCIFSFAMRDIGSICFDRTGRNLITSSNKDGLIWVWDTTTGQAIRTIDSRNTEFYGLAVSPDNCILAAAGEALGESGGKIYLWDLTSGDFLGELEGHQEAVWTLAFDPNGQYLYSGGSDGSIRVWDFHSLKMLHSLTGHTDQIKALVVDPQGRLIASAGQDSTIRIWETADFTCTHVLSGHAGAILSLSINAESMILCSTGVDETIRLWDLGKMQLINVLRIMPPYQEMKISAVTGLTQAQIKKLKDLGAIDYTPKRFGI